MERYDLFIFDFDGTLADSKTHIAYSFNLSLTQNNLPKTPISKIAPTIGKLPIQDTFRLFYPELPTQAIEELTVSFRRNLLLSTKEKLRLFPSVYDTLEKLTKNGKELAILTTKNTDLIMQILTYLDISHFFTIVCGGDHICGKKPDKACIQYINSVTRKKIDSKDVVMVGDTLVDLETARNADIDMIGVAYGIDGKEVLSRNGAKYIISNFSELLTF